MGNAAQLANLGGAYGAGSTFGFKNRIINGAMMIDQRNAGGSVTPSSGQYTLDRWQYQATQSSKASVQQVSTAPDGFINSLRVTSASAYTVLSTDVFQVIQPIEGLNVSDLNWGTASAATVTLSFKVYSSLTGTFGGYLTNSAGDRNYIFSYSIPVANTWTNISVTIAGDTTGTWLKTNGQGIVVGWSLGCGSTYATTAGSWGSPVVRGLTGQTNVVATNGATFFITGVQLEKGSTATSFDYRPYGTELALCQRYYERLLSRFFGLWASASQLRVYTYFKATKRATPTMRLLTTTPGAEQIGVTGVTATAATIPFTGGNVDGIDIIVDGFSGRAYGQFACSYENILAADSEL